jgi:hypothetical protein
MGGGDDNTGHRTPTTLTPRATGVARQITTRTGRRQSGGRGDDNGSGEDDEGEGRGRGTMGRPQ